MTQQSESMRWQGTERFSAEVARGMFEVAEGAAIPSRVRCELTGADDTGGKWPDLVLRYEVRDGVPMCTGISVTSPPGAREARPDFLTTDQVTEYGDRAFVAFAMRTWRTASGGRGAAIGAPVEAGSIMGRKALRGVRRARPKARVGLPDELRRVARVYLAPESAPNRTDAVWRQLDYGSRETANRRVRAARDAGLIPPVRSSAAELAAALRRVNALDDAPTSMTLDEARQWLGWDRSGEAGRG